MLFWIELELGLIIILVLIYLGLQTSKDKKKTINDEKTLQIIKSELDKDGYDFFELESITSLDNPDITSVIVNTGSLEIGFEINNTTGKITNKERLAR